MRSKRCREEVSSCIKFIYERWNELCAEYGIEPPCNINIIDAAEEHDPEQIKFLAECGFDSSIMVTLQIYFVDKDDIIRSFDVLCVVNYTELLTIILEYRLDYDLVKQYLENVMRHEIGHILYGMGNINKPFSEHDVLKESTELAKKNMPKVRKNSSCKSLFNFERMYHSAPLEKIADEMAGLSVKTWAIDFALPNPGYSRKQLGVEEYLTEEEFKEIRKRAKVDI